MKIRLYTLLFLAFNFPNIFAQLAGSYVLPGGDAMSATHLFLLSEHIYAFAYFGGIDVGTWKETGENTIELTRADCYNEAFYVYGRHSERLPQDSIKIQYQNCSDGSTAISFDNDTVGLMKMTAIFNKDANCFSYPYAKCASARATQIHLSIYEKYQPSLVDRILEKKYIYTFDLNKDFNDYRVIFNDKATRQSQKMTAELVENGLRIGEGREIFKKSRKISEEDYESVKEYYKAASEQSDSSKKTLFDNYEQDERVTLEYDIIPKIKESWKMATVDSSQPLFVTTCENR